MRTKAKKETQRIAQAIVSKVFAESRRVVNMNISPMNEMGIAAILTGLTGFFVAGYRSDFDLCQELTPTYQKRIMSSVGKEDYDNYSYMVNDSYIKFRDTGIKYQYKTEDWATRMMDEFAEVLLVVLRANATDYSKDLMLGECQELLQIAKYTYEESHTESDVEDVDNVEESRPRSESRTKRFSVKWWLKNSYFFTMAIGFLFTVVLDVRLSEERSQKATELNELKGKYKVLESSYNDVQNKYTTLSSENETLKSTNGRLVEQVRGLSQESHDYSDLTYLASRASTTNGFVSVNSKAFVVKKGNKETIKVNWPNYETSMYMGTSNTSIISAAWKDSDVVVTGLRAGVTDLTFSSDSAGTKDTFTVIIICYE